MVHGVPDAADSTAFPSRRRVDAVLFDFHGTLAQVEGLEPLDLEVCDEVELDEGEHRITAPRESPFQVDSLVMEPDVALAAPAGREVDVLRWDDEHRSVRVADGDEATLLPVHRQFLYLPLEHSEDLADQERSVAEFKRLTHFDEAE